MTTFLSIDYDFFPYIPIYETVTTGKGEEVPGLFVFDYGHSEGRSDSLQDFLWGTRYSGARLHYGLELDEYMKPKLPVARFAYEVRARYEPDRTSFADSHRFGYNAVAACAQREGEPVHVVHFDAHHDLGYGAETIKSMEKEGHTDCGSWLYFALREGHVATVEIVYPDWQGLAEWQCEDEDPFADKPWLEPYRDRITVTTWSEWLARGSDIAEEPADVFVCRSSAWVPPWCEDDFWRLIDKLGMTGTMNFDDAERREWDRERAIEQAGQYAEMIGDASALQGSD